MKCAVCQRESCDPTLDKFGQLFISTRMAQPLVPSDIFLDLNHLLTYSGQVVSWFVCDKCAKKGHDWTGLGFMSIVLAICIPFWATLEIIYLILSSICFPFALYCLSYWFKGPDYRSKYCRDKMLQKVIEKLIFREDFVEIYGKINIDGPGTDKTLTRFQRDTL